MERIEFDYLRANRCVSRRVHAGVVSSGDMEILVEPAVTAAAHVSILTSVDGFAGTWKAIFDRFFADYDGAVRIHINDAGATPGRVRLRLEQVLEVIEQ